MSSLIDYLLIGNLVLVALLLVKVIDFTDN